MPGIADSNPVAISDASPFHLSVMVVKDRAVERGASHITPLCAMAVETVCPDGSLWSGVER